MGKIGRPKGSGVTPAIDRFEAKVVKTESCWEWVGCRHPSGYGKFFIKKDSTGRRHLAYAHRWSYEHFVGPIPEGLEIDHLCRVRYCVNPQHLELVTRAENLRRIPELPPHMRPRTHCKRGHEFTPDNIYVSTKGRQCRACRLQSKGARI